MGLNPEEGCDSLARLRDLVVIVEINYIIAYASRKCVTVLQPREKYQFDYSMQDGLRKTSPLIIINSKGNNIFGILPSQAPRFVFLWK